MNGFQISNALNIIPETENLFRGCYYNRNIPFSLFNERTCFFIVNTKTNLSRSMGHWILFYIRDYYLLFFDSFALEPRFYGWDIEEFYEMYPGCKSIMISRPLQNEFSYVCGAYCVVVSYLLSKNYTVKRIHSLFTKKTRKNDSYVSNYLYSLVGVSLSCNQQFCPGTMFGSTCRNYCSC